MTLETRLLDFDGKAVTLLSEARTACRDEPGFLSALVGFCADGRADVSAGATWILKAELEDGASLSPPLTARLVASLETITAWQAQLHLCQLISMLSLAPDQAEAVRTWLWPFLSHERPFLRAWALDALCRLPGARADQTIRDTLYRLESDPAASVRARARKLRREFA